jgi:hypothetical protein
VLLRKEDGNRNHHHTRSTSSRAPVTFLSIVVDVEVPTFPRPDGGEVVSCKRRPRFTTNEDSWCSILLEAESNPGPNVRTEGLGKLQSAVT